MEVQWIADSSSRFLYRSWQDETVAYDTLTGDTHLLEPAAVELLRRLRKHAETKTSLARHLSESFELSPEDDILAITESTLKRLEAIGVAVAVSP